jgi:spermidine synthase
VLWLKELGLLFGNTAHASAVGPGIFFAGLAAGGWFWGTRSRRPYRPLARYGWLEVGIAVSALPFFWLTEVYRTLHAPLFAFAGSSPELFVAAKAALAFVVLFPPAFFMGGTVPVLGEAAIPRVSLLGRRGAWL